MQCGAIHNPAELETSALEETFEAWAEAVATSDPVALGNLLTEDVEFWSHGQEPLVGRQAAADAFRDLFAAYEMEQRFECRELIVAENWAFVRGVELNELQPKGEGNTLEVKQRAFSVLRRGKDGRWRFSRGMTNNSAHDTPTTE